MQLQLAALMEWEDSMLIRVKASMRSLTTQTFSGHLEHSGSKEKQEPTVLQYLIVEWAILRKLIQFCALPKTISTVNTLVSKWRIALNKNKFEIKFSAPNPLLDEPNEATEEPYRLCGAIRNIRNANGTWIRTICVVYDYKMYNDAKTNCVDNQMNLVKLDSLAMENGVMSYCSQQFTWAFPGYAWVDGNKLSGQCSVITNVYKSKSADYNLTSLSCGNSFYHICEFKPQVGKYRKF